MSHKKHKNSEWFIHVLRIVRRVLFERTHGSHDGATTTDFSTFSDPVKWIDRKNSVINSTMLRDDDGWWYRASKDSEITIERTRNPYASAYEVLRTDDDQQWSYVGSLTDILGNGRYPWMYLEGPEDRKSVV